MRIEDRPGHWPAPVYDFPLAQTLHDLGAGLFELPETAAKKHHYVPQFLIRRFSTDPSGKFVHQLTKSDGTVRSVPIRTAAQKSHLYGVNDPEGNVDNRIESAFGLFENEASHALRMLSDPSGVVGEPEIIVTAFFLALQFWRTPMTLEAVGADFENVLRSSLSELVEDPDRFSREGAAAMPPGTTPDQAERFRQKVSEAMSAKDFISFDQTQLGLSALIDLLIPSALKLAHGDWELLHSDDSQFVLGDLGHVRISDEDRWHSGARAVVFPIDSRTAVWVSPPTTEGTQLTRRICENKLVERINLRSFGWSGSVIFGGSESSLESLEATARARPEESRAVTSGELNVLGWGW